jgi:predicted  nucleic acid-binding Zn-ribbon protein
MNTRHRLQAIVFPALMLLSAPVSTQQASPGTVEEELHSLAMQTGETVKLLRQLVTQNAADQQLKRLQVAIIALQLRSVAIGEIEARIQTLEDRAASANEELAQLEAESERVGTLADRESIPEGERDHLSSMKTMLESQIEMIKERIWLIESKIVDLQNDLAAKRRDVDALEEIVMEGLGDL